VSGSPAPFVGRLSAPEPLLPRWRSVGSSTRVSGAFGFPLLTEPSTPTPSVDTLGCRACALGQYRWVVVLGGWSL